MSHVFHALPCNERFGTRLCLAWFLIMDTCDQRTLGACRVYLAPFARNADSTMHMKRAVVHGLGNLSMVSIAAHCAFSRKRNDEPFVYLHLVCLFQPLF